MFDISLAFNLVLHLFSFKKERLRFPTPKRVFSALIILPSFLILILVNRFFMALDEIVFPGFRKCRVSNVAFITGVPRSATTYLYHLLAKDSKNFTCFRLWEILFAPSIIQKAIFSLILRFDRWVGRPLYRTSLLWDRIFLPHFAKLHETGLAKPEEDEILLIYAFASVYLEFFFPDVPALDPYLFFDEAVPPLKRRKIMLFYKQCIQRHVYFYDRYEKKFFLSKNPSFVSKTDSLAETFKDAKLIYMLRSPFKTIPSTISLNKNIYSIFSGGKNSKLLRAKTEEIIIRWYKMAEHSVSTKWLAKHVIVPFREITHSPATTIMEIYAFLNLIPSEETKQELAPEQQICLKYISKHKYDHLVQNENVSAHLNFILNGRFKDKI